MLPENFQFLCDLLHQRSGLVLSEKKAYLVEARLIP
ncbi:MAG: chemotaxis protein CheR, partial [Alphaproteobacteria bacterium]